MNAPDTDPAAREPAPPELAAREASPRGAAARRPPARELTKILSDCRDLAVHRLILTFSAMLDRIGDMLMERANRSDIRDDTTHFLAARSALVAERGNVMAEFERRLREAVDQRIAGDPAAKTDFSKVDAENLTLIDTAAMDESVIAGNITRVVENLCDDELQVLNRGMAHLLGRPDLETLSNPLAPSAVIGAFAAALRGVAADERIKFTILKELNQSSLGDLNAIYADVNRHLANLNVVPAAARPTLVNLDYVNNRARVKAKAAAKAAARSSAAEVDVMALFKKMFAGQYQGAPAQPFAGGGFGMPGMAAGMAGMGGGMPGIAGANPGMGGAMPRFAPGMMGVGGFPGMHGPGGHAPGSGGHSASGEDATNPYWMLGVEPPRDGAAQGMPHPRAGGPGMMPGMPGAMQGGGLGGPGASLDAIPRDAASGPKFIPQSPLPPTPSGYVPGLPIIATRELGESLTRLQAGESGFDLGGGAYVRFSGIPEGKRNVLRDLQESPLSLRVNQIEAMTIELVAMLFDFIFETRDLPDGIKALIGRLQIPVLKAAMLDGAFFAKKTHPARVLVNALSEAGMAWLETMGHEDPLYREIDRIVHRILDDFADNLTIFEDLRKDLERFLEKEEAAAEDNIQSKTVEITQSDRREIAPVIASAEIERQIGGREIPNFVAALLRERWARTLETLYIEDRENSDGWSDALSTVTDLIWSVQPKRTTEERRQLVSMLPSLLKRLTEPLDETTWPMDEREQFLANLVEAHAAAVKPVLAPDRLPTAAVALQAKAEAEEAKAAGDEVGAAKAERLAHAMAPAEPPPSPVAPAEEDPFLEIAQGLDRGVWVEFEDGDGQLAFRKLAWVSPLRGTYLFCNRQGQKAMSLTAEELATRFRSDTARLVEAEPLVDRAFTSMMAGFNQKLQQPAA